MYKNPLYDGVLSQIEEFIDGLNEQIAKKYPPHSEECPQFVISDQNGVTYINYMEADGTARPITAICPDRLKMAIYAYNDAGELLHPITINPNSSFAIKKVQLDITRLTGIAFSKEMTADVRGPRIPSFE